jgi:hypothetical protein
VFDRISKKSFSPLSAHERDVLHELLTRLVE